MRKQQDHSSPLSRLTVFSVGGFVTLALALMTVLCVPKKPDVIADAALSQLPPELADSSGNVSQQQSNGPAALRAAGTGERLYARFCASCHGEDGRAQTTMARMMNPQPTNFVTGPWKSERSAAAIIEVVKNGRGAMPSYGREITGEGELNALAEHVLSLGEAQKK